MMVVELLASHTYVPSKFLFRKENTTYWLSDLLYFKMIDNSLGMHAQIWFFFLIGLPVASGPSDNLEETTKKSPHFFSVQTLRCFHSCFNVAANGSNRVWERMYQVVVLVKMWRLFGCSFQIVGRSVCDRRPDEKKNHVWACIRKELSLILASR